MRPGVTRHSRHSRLSLRDNLIALAGGILVALAVVLLTLALT